MKPTRIVRNCLGLAALVACLSACGSSSSGAPAGGAADTNWDQLVWDQDNWS